MEPQKDPLSVFNHVDLRIRGSQVKSSDFAVFSKRCKLKVPGTAMNALAAVLQHVSEEQGNSGSAIFSSWLGPLICHDVPQNTFYGTINGHIENACNGSMAMLSAKSIWIFPMCKGNPSHWVLGWLELATRRYHIFNSVPELPILWAEPALLEIGDTVFAHLGEMKVDWESWKLISHSPAPLDCQMNGWDCGIFVIHVMLVLVNGWDISEVKNSETERIRQAARKLVEENLVLFKPYATPLPQEKVQSTAAAVSLPVTASDSTSDNAPTLNIASSRTDDVTPNPESFDLSIKPGNEIHPSIVSGSSLKRKRPSSSTIFSDSDSNSQSDDDGTPKKLAKKAWTKRRGKGTKVYEREQSLLANKWVDEVEAHRVKCRGCHKWIKLDNETLEKEKEGGWRDG
ncbi:ULP-PROTEASE domain-containing protein [Mycena indigotica]|uniref:ULP-PROTEASE domain-containing protein n=1 Tax=Mycena indigotica TaxID=2126181 RepID=A0A8H6S994_9AGAR|nr:ULP-PROTEASE domain-containing protein [Mycena indigotica]KAF7293650.1 ULP-PROTEASE domain-containing protein [Mycena indigotica]